MLILDILGLLIYISAAFVVLGVYLTIGPYLLSRYGRSEYAETLMNIMNIENDLAQLAGDVDSKGIKLFCKFMIALRYTCVISMLFYIIIAVLFAM